MTAVCAPVFSQTPLTLEQAQQRAVARSRQLSAQDMATLAAREMAIAAGQLPDPVLKAGIDNLPVSGADRFSLGNDFMTMRRVGVMQEITGTEKRQLRAARYERAADKSIAEKSLTAASIRRDTALAWIDRFYLEATAILIEEQATQARLEIQAADGAYRGGRGTPADVLAARSALVAVDDRRSEITRRVADAKTMLARWVGNHTDLPLGPIASTDVIRLDPATLETQLSHHPQLAVQARQEDLARVEAKLAEAAKKSDWSVEVAFQQRGSAYSNMISIGVSLPLQWDPKNRQDRELASKLALVEQARAEREEMLRTHVAETRVMISEWTNTRERYRRYQTELLPLADQRIEAVLASYRGGKSPLADLLAARRAGIDLRMQALQLQMEGARLWARLNFLAADDGAATTTATHRSPQ
ncbi:MAG: TolC family protein [Herminiimonas sp.]|nr:TolC family protein [Herminiimonas sp.]